MNNHKFKGRHFLRVTTTRILVIAVSLTFAGLGPAADAAGIAASADGSRMVYVAGDSGLSARGEDGQVVWRALADIHVHEPAVVGDLLLAAGGSGLHALDRANGHTRWQAASDVGLFTPAVTGSVAYAGALDGVLRAIDLHSGQLLWQRRFDGWVYSPALVGGVAVAGGSAALLVAMRTADGAELWRRELGQELFYEPLALPGGRVLVTTFGGDLHVLSASDGASVWTTREPVPALLPALVDEVLVYALMDGRVRARALADGRLLWELDPEVGRLLAPRAIGDGVAFASESGRVLWLEARSGEVRLNRLLGARPLSSPLRVGAQLLTPLAEGGLARHSLPESAPGDMPADRTRAETVAHR